MLAFLVTALVGLAIRVYAPAVVRELFGDRAFQFEFFLPRLLLPALVAAVAGYVLPRGFFLWGVAVVLLHPLNEALWTNRALEAGAIESSELGGRMLVETMFFVLFAGACTGTAALGAGLRLLWWWFRGEPIGGLRTTPNGN